MSDRDFVAPIERVDDDERDLADPLGAFDTSGSNQPGPQFRLNFDPDERAFLVRLLGELKELLTSEETEQTTPLLHRLFPPAFHDDPEKEAEYQRLMRDELVTSRLTAIETATDFLTPDDPAAAHVVLGEGDTMLFMQSVNAVRLVLGTMLDITDDESADAADMDDSYEYGLYDHLGWILEFAVRALSGS